MYACEQAHIELAKILILNKAKFSFFNPLERKGFTAVADNMDLFKFFYPILLKIIIYSIIKKYLIARVAIIANI